MLLQTRKTVDSELGLIRSLEITILSPEGGTSNFVGVAFSACTAVVAVEA